MKRVFAMAAVTGWVFALVQLRSAFKDFLWTHPWWHSFLVALPTIAQPVLAYLELRHSAEANVLRADANRLRAVANALQDQIGTLNAELDAERRGGRSHATLECRSIVVRPCPSTGLLLS